MSDTGQATTTTSTPSSNAQDPNQSIVSITDFSPGVYKYGLGAALPTTYGVGAPLGSASFAARCINKPGIGLIPFVGHSIFGHTGGVQSSFTTCWNTGLASVGGAGGEQPSSQPLSIVGFQPFPIQELIVCGYASFNGGSSITSMSWGASLIYPNPTNSAFLSPGQNLWTESPSTFNGTPYFPSHSFTYYAAEVLGGIAYEIAAVAPGFSGYFVTPNYSIIAGQLNYVVETGITNVDIVACYSYNGRLLLFTTVAGGIVLLESTTYGTYTMQEQIEFTDPPQAFSVAATMNTFPSPQSPSGYGAWGSVSSGELFLIRQGLGGVIVNGDFAAPSSVIQLPGVTGTGRIMQRGTICGVGMVYVTEYDGVYAWNGGASASKISAQLPDDACLRPEMQNAYGVRVHHDVQNGLVFFANNWVYDSVNNSWWQCEDPAVINYAVFSRSGVSTQYMWAMTAAPDNPLGGTPAFNLHGFDWTTRASSWQWISNPIPVSVGSMAEVDFVEIIASNPTSTPSTITITPQSPPLIVSRVPNNAQAQIFTIPANCSGVRLSARFGYEDYNITLGVVAANSTGLAAPILHAINIGYTAGGPTSLT